jgi:tellurite resistance protein
MTSLSPAAQAVLDAAIKVAESPDAEAIAAAALRAAADQARDNPWPGRIESVGVMWMHDGLLAIAAELETSTAENR